MASAPATGQAASAAPLVCEAPSGGADPGVPSGLHDGRAPEVPTAPPLLDAVPGPAAGSGGATGGTGGASVPAGDSLSLIPFQFSD